MGRLFNRAGVEFKVLSEEPCCGWSLYQLGDFEGARELSAAVSEALQDSGASTIVVLEADCYRMLLTRTNRFGGDLSGLKVVHVTHLLSEWLETGTIEIIDPISKSVTYHDPCALARYCDETEAPRTILQHLLQRDLLEMETNRKLANCCGAGGVLEVYRPELSNRIACLRIEEAEATGASILATGCVRCDNTFLRAIGPEGRSLEVKNIVELTAAAVEAIKPS
jgi:Fe-S oxidoreductase